MIDNYLEYLHQQDYSESSIAHSKKRIQCFYQWLTKRKLTAELITYKDTIQYIKHLQQTHVKPQTINNNLSSLRLFFNYLVQENYRIDNPLEAVKVQGTVKKLLHNLLDSDELEDLYYSFDTESNSKYANYRFQKIQKRNKIIVGLLVYQGLNTTNLKSLTVEHLQLKKGKIYVPSTRKNSAREIELKPWQIMDAIEYVTEIRPQIAKEKQIHSEQLFIPTKYLNDIIYSSILKQLKKINHKVINVNQIRASVICNWLKQHNIRKTQYLAGHKYISSTEAYKQTNLENLHEAIEQFHPIS